MPNGKKQPDTPYESFLEAEISDTPDNIDSFIEQLQELAQKLRQDGATRGDAKLLLNATKELRHCFRVFAEYRGTRKATVFGSARTKPDHPAYQAALKFGEQIQQQGWMVITGAASGIMEAGNVGAGRDHSFGLNILLPFEQGANAVVAGDPKLMNMRYFFTRKLMFIKESDAVILFPGGFGTHDEAFETLTLIQTGKTHIFPIVLVDQPGGTYWKNWHKFVLDELLANQYIDSFDIELYKMTDSVEEAVAIVQQFYKNYHSMRYVRGQLVFRLQKPVPEKLIRRLDTEYQDILTEGGFRNSTALPEEKNEPMIFDLPRLVFAFNKHDHGRLRMLIDELNQQD